MTATITTVIPTYRRPDLLRRAILSVLKQEDADLQVAVFDDASGDNTPEVVAEIARRDPRVRYVCHPRNLGMMPNTAAAVDAVRTPYFTILNDDDLLAPRFFSTALEAFKRHSTAGAFVGRLIYWDMEDKDRTRTVFNCESERLVPAIDAALDIIAGEQSHTWTSMMFRREVLDEIGGIDPEVGYAADLDFELRVFAHYPAIFNPHRCAIYCLSPHSSSYSDSLIPYVASMRRILRKFVADSKLDADGRRRVVEAMTGQFRRSAIVGAARSLTRDKLESARRAAAFLESELASPHSASAIRFASEATVVGRATRLALRPLQYTRRRFRRDPELDGILSYVDQVLALLSRQLA